MSPEPRPLDPEALEAQTKRLRGLARSLVRDYDGADDVIQETCLKALTGSVKPRRSLGACLSGVVRNVAYKLQRSEGRRGTHERAAARPESLPATVDMLARLDEQRRVLACVHALDEPYRSTVLLRFFEDRSPKEIAHRLGVPVETVKTRLKRGLGKLRKAMDEQHGGNRRTWLAALLPVAGFRTLRTTAVTATGGSIVTQTLGMRAAFGLLAALALGAGTLYAGGFFDTDDEADPAGPPVQMTADAPDSGRQDSSPKGPTLEGDASARSRPGKSPASEAVVATAAGQTDKTAPDTTAAGARGARDDSLAGVKPAVRRSPYGLPKRKGTRLGGGGGMGGPTGHWTKYGPPAPAKGTARLSVTVLDAAGAPLPGADVYIGPPDEAGVNGISFGDLRKVGKTNARGTLLATALPDGGASVFGNLGNRLNGRFGLDGRHGRTTLLRPGQTARVALELPFAIGKLGAVSGRVLDADGKPLRSASVAVGFSQRWSKADGTFEIRGVPEGEARLAVRATGYASRSIPIDVKAGQSTRKDIRLELAEQGDVRLEGLVVGPQGEPVEGANIYVMLVKDRGTLRSLRTDAAGRFVLKKLPERIRTEAVRLQAGKLPFYASKVIAYEEGLREERVTLDLPTRYVRFELRILDAQSGEAIRQCRAYAERAESRRPKSTLAGGGGNGTRRGMVEPGRHKVTIEALDHENRTFELDIQPNSDGRFLHTVKLARTHPPSVQIILTVEVVNALDGAPIESVRIEVRDAATREALSRFEGRRDGGLFRMPALSGDRQLLIQAKGYEEQAVALPLDPAEGEARVKVELRPH